MSFSSAARHINTTQVREWTLQPTAAPFGMNTVANCCSISHEHNANGVGTRDKAPFYLAQSSECLPEVPVFDEKLRAHVESLSQLAMARTVAA